MTNLEYISQQLDYAEEQFDSACDPDSRMIWGSRVAVLEEAWESEASKHVSQDARDSVPQVLTVNYI